MAQKQLVLGSDHVLVWARVYQEMNLEPTFSQMHTWCNEAVLNHTCNTCSLLELPQFLCTCKLWILICSICLKQINTLDCINKFWLYIPRCIKTLQYNVCIDQVACLTSYTILKIFHIKFLFRVWCTKLKIYDYVKPVNVFIAAITFIGPFDCIWH